MGIIVCFLLWVVQDVFHQPQGLGFKVWDPLTAYPPDTQKVPLWP